MRLSASLAACAFLASLLLWGVGCGAPQGPELVRWPEVLPSVVVIESVRVLDVVSGERSGPVDVAIEEGRITSIVPAPVQRPARTGDAARVDGRGATLLPGLIDMHGHVDSRTGPVWDYMAKADPALNLRAFVYSGVTTVFDPGDSSGREAFARRARVASREQIGPQILTAGPIVTAPGSHPVAMVELMVPGWIRWLLPELARTVANDADVERVVDRIASDGADAIKIIVDRIPLTAQRMTPQLATAIVDRAREHGLRTVAHVGTTEDAIDAGRAGVALWVHGVYKERIPDQGIDELVAFGIPMVTTSEVFDAYGRARSGPIEATRLERETVPPEVLASFYPIPEDAIPAPLESWVELMETTPEIRRANVARLHEAGMTILAGSDVQSGVFPGASLHRELVGLVAAGLSPVEAIRAATLEPARFLTESDDPSFGIVAVGKRADLILVEGDPTSDVGALEALRSVILNGVPMERRPIAH